MLGMTKTYKRIPISQSSFYFYIKMKRKDALERQTQPQGTEQSEIRPMAIMDFGFWV